MQEKQINIELGEKEAEGIYSNFVLISHSPAEFIFDFVRMVPGAPKAKVHARIISTPPHAKAFLDAMKENIEKYEKEYGEIKTIKKTESKGFGFKISDEQTGGK